MCAPGFWGGDVFDGCVCERVRDHTKNSREGGLNPKQIITVFDLGLLVEKMCGRAWWRLLNNIVKNLNNIIIILIIVIMTKS